MNKPKTHRIRSFRGLDKIINEENIDMIMGNFYGVMKSYLQLKKLHPDLKLTGFTWIDDGLIEIREPEILVSKRFTIDVTTKKQQ